MRGGEFGQTLTTPPLPLPFEGRGVLSKLLHLGIKKNEFFLFCSRFFVTLTLSKLLHLGIKKNKFFLFCSRFFVTLTLSKLLHLGIKKNEFFLFCSRFFVTLQRKFYCNTKNTFASTSLWERHKDGHAKYLKIYWKKTFTKLYHITK